MSDDGCPGPVNCPLYIIAHDARIGHLGCVRDLAEPCEGAGNPERYRELINRAQDEILTGLRARLGVPS
jgi:hypothetical protein